jgi:hypothetical protein
MVRLFPHLERKANHVLIRSMGYPLERLCGVLSSPIVGAMVSPPNAKSGSDNNGPTRLQHKSYKMRAAIFARISAVRFTRS